MQQKSPKVPLEKNHKKKEKNIKKPQKRICD